MEEITSTKRFFLSHNITLSDDWLASCINWYRGENPNLNYTHQTLHSAVYTQWLLLDLRDVEVPILPPNVAQQKKIILNDIYCLQLLQIQDIAHPKLVQIQKIRNSLNNQDQNVNVGSNRMLQMLLTDGVQQIEAIEYKPVKVLNANLKPGIKIKITGPIMVRRGQMMLEEKHVHLLGGEVEELLVANAYENVLARALHLPENPKPNLIEESVVAVNVDVTRNVQNTPKVLDQYLTRPHGNKSSPGNINAPNIPLDFDETLINDEIDMLLEAERDMAAAQPPAISYEEMDDNDELFLEAERNIATVNNTTLNHENNQNFPTGAQIADLNESLFGDMDIDAHLDMIDEQQDHKSDNGGNKVVSIMSLLENRSNITLGRFTINAKFKKVVQKLTVRDDGWSLNILVRDGTGDMEVKVHTDVVSNWIGYDSSAMIALRKNVMDKDVNVASALRKGIGDMKDKITKIDGEMVITFTSKEELPSIVKIM